MQEIVTSILRYIFDYIPNGVLDFLVDVFRPVFSAQNWFLSTGILIVLGMVYLCTQNTRRLIAGTPTTVFPWLLALVLILYIGTRPLNCYTDTGLYTAMFQLVQSNAWHSLPPSEPGWNWLEYLCIELTTASGWLLTVATIYIGTQAVAIYRWMPRHMIIGLLFLVADFSFFGYATNGIRNGMAAGIAMLGLSCCAVEGRRALQLIGLGIILVATTVHYTMTLVFVCAVGAVFIRGFKLPLVIWLVCAVVGFLFSDTLKLVFGGLVEDDRMASYASDAAESDMFSRTGFRWDFMLYSAMPILLGWYAMVRRGLRDARYHFVLVTYMLANSFWLLINTIAYSNRFAYLSWFLYPILLAYPLVKLPIWRHNQGLVAAAILLGCLLFRTLF